MTPRRWMFFFAVAILLALLPACVFPHDSERESRACEVAAECSADEVCYRGFCIESAEARDAGHSANGDCCDDSGQDDRPSDEEGVRNENWQGHGQGQRDDRGEDRGEDDED